MSNDGFIPVLSKKSRKQRQAKQPEPVTQVEVDDWNERLEQWQGKPDESAWFKPIEKPPELDLKVWEFQGRIDSLKDFIPFWRRNVYAAENGQEMEKYEGFLEEMAARENCPWGEPQPNESAAGWDNGAAAVKWEDAADLVWPVEGASDEKAWRMDNADTGGWGVNAWEPPHDPWAAEPVVQNTWSGTPSGPDNRKLDNTPRVGGNAKDTEVHSWRTKGPNKAYVPASRKKKNTRKVCMQRSND
ncbi:hypothetical protein BDW22DRAFT_1350732 [Trametopsis cervina]|nr:hypothetical protein BDW22DRAFT_1350732 [Trametopsis cervina]